MNKKMGQGGTGGQEPCPKELIVMIKFKTCKRDEVPAMSST